MSRAPWPLVELTARLLEREEREAVLGDLTESGDNASQAFFGVLGLLARRNAELWRAWQPWVAAFGLALPASFLLMGASISVSSTYGRLFDAKNFGPCAATGNEGYWLLLCHVLLLAGWSWTSGCRRDAFTANPLGQCFAESLALSVLPHTIPNCVLIEVLAAFVPGAGYCWSMAGSPRRRAEATVRDCIGSRDDRGDGRRLWRASFVDFELGAGLARVVPSRDGAETNLAESPN